MPTSSILNKTSRTLASQNQESYRNPYYDCQEMSHALKVVVYLPGVASHDVEIRASGPDLTVTARKSHVVRVNWQALHLEGAQRDYRLRLRLGAGFDYEALLATFNDGVLTVTLPKQQVAVPRQRSVA